jgi:hypothetical protein
VPGQAGSAEIATAETVTATEPPAQPEATRDEATRDAQAEPVQAEPVPAQTGPAQAEAALPEATQAEAAQAEAAGAGRRRSRRWVDWTAAAVLLLGAAGICLAMKAQWLAVLWSDEVWRAYEASRPGSTFWSDLHAAAGPSALGWLAATRLAGNVFGWHGWVLRSVELGAITLLGAATYLLARRFVGPLAAAVCGVLVVFNQEVLYQGVQLKPYAVEMLVTVAILGLWVTAPRSASGPGATRSRLLRFGGVAALGLFSLPAPFVVGPLAAADALSGRGLRGKLRAGAETLVAALPVAAHTLFFAGQQGNLRQSTFWNSYFLSGRGPAEAARFIWQQSVGLAEYLPPGVQLGPDGWSGRPAELLTSALPVLAYVVVLAWALGIAALLRSHAGRLLLATAVGGVLLMLLASADRAWPFGAVRTNVFLTPALLVMAAAGVTEGVRLIRRGLPRLAGLAAAAVPVTALVALLAVLTTGSTVWSWQHRLGPRHGSEMTAVTASIRQLAHPGDVAVVTGVMAHYSYRYEMEVSDDGSAPADLPRLPEQDAVLVRQIGDGSAAAAIAARASRPSQVFLIIAAGTNGTGYRAMLTELRTVGYCPRGIAAFRTTGLLTRLVLCTSLPPAAS